MITLIISTAKRNMPGLHLDKTRLRYRVQLADGSLLTLAQVALKLKIPYSSLAPAIRAAELTFGAHTDAFYEIIARVRKQRRRVLRGTISCSACAGKGRVPAPLQPVEEEPNDQPPN